MPNSNLWQVALVLVTSRLPDKFLYFSCLLRGDFYTDRLIHYICILGFFRGIFKMLCSTQLLLPPLRFHCVGGCWDWTQDCCDFGIGSHSLTVKRSSNQSARSHPQLFYMTPKTFHDKLNLSIFASMIQIYVSLLWYVYYVLSSKNCSTRRGDPYMPRLSMDGKSQKSRNLISLCKYS